jgi:hypothetical protein
MSLRETISGLFNRLTSNAKRSSVSRNPSDNIIKRIGLVFVKSGGGGGNRAEFEPPDFDLEEINLAYDNDAYVRQAIDKYTDLIFKAGWDIVSPNDNAKDYIKTRLSLIAEATQTPTEEFFNQIAEDLVKYSNVFIVKARLAKSGDYKFPSGINVKGLDDMEPIVGYFVLPPETIEIARDKNGRIVRYKQEIQGGGKEITFKPQDIIHITWKKKRGNAFGVPFLLPVLPDVRLLREVEDNVHRLLHKYLHPLYKFTVGLPEEGFESTPEEVEQIRDEIEKMTTDGTMVLPERYNLEVVGAEGEAINAKWALEYFEQRVFTGLGVPETVFGRSNTANRSTADNLTSEMHDRIKAFQRVIATAIDNMILNELLMEGGFDPIINPQDDADFIFEEIAIDEQIKLENQAMYLYEHNGITFPEFRNRIGYEPEIEESEMYLHRVQLAQISAKASSTEPGSPETNNKQKPENQHGKKVSPKKTSASRDENAPSISSTLNIQKCTNYLKSEYENLRQDISELIKKGKSSPDFLLQVPMTFSMIEDRLNKELSSTIKRAFKKGIDAAKVDCNVSRNPEIDKFMVDEIVLEGAKADISSLFSEIRVRVASSSEDKIPAIFDVMKYRLPFIARTRTMKAYNYGYALAANALERNEMVSISNSEVNDECKDKQNQLIELSGDLYKNIPPWHTNCWCTVKIKEIGGET